LSYATRPTGGREVASMTMRQLATMRHPIVFLLGALAAVVGLVVLGPIRVVDAADPAAPPVEAETFDVRPTGTSVVTDTALYSNGPQVLQ
jgi:hypothetical protein